MLTGADAVVRALEAAGVELAFGLPGVHNLALWRSLEESSIRLVGVRHEQTAAYAADGYARAAGGDALGVAVVTTGPGAANTLAAVGEAFASRSPLLVIATDVPTSVRRPGVWRGSLHETTDQAAMFRPVVKAALRAPKGADLGRAVTEAAAAARAAPARPVYMEIPTDLLQAEGREPRAEPRAEPPPLPHDPFVRAGELMSRARSPLIWAGGGAVAAAAGDSVAELAERLVAPVFTTYSARGLLPPDHPCDVGVSAHFPQAGALWDEADLVISIGSDLDGMMTQNWAQPQPPHLLAVNVDAEDASKNYLPDLVLETDARAGSAALGHRVEPRGGLDALRRRLERLRGEVRSGLEQSDPEALGFLDALDRALPPEAVVVCDMCIPAYWLGALRRPAGPRRLLYPLGWGTLGCAFPQALGAALATDAPVVSVSGDGGFLYACAELAAAAQEEIPVTALVIDDGGYGMLRYDQELRGDPNLGVDLHTPEFEALARSFGVRAETVDGLGEAFEAKLQHHAGLREPTLLAARAALAPPPNVSPRWYRR